MLLLAFVMTGLLHTAELVTMPSGTCFHRLSQLSGRSPWKRARLYSVKGKWSTIGQRDRSVPICCRFCASGPRGIQIDAPPSTMTTDHGSRTLGAAAV